MSFESELNINDQEVVPKLYRKTRVEQFTLNKCLLKDILLVLSRV